MRIWIRCFRNRRTNTIRWWKRFLSLLLQISITIPSIVACFLLHIIDSIEIALFEMFKTLSSFVMRITFRIRNIFSMFWIIIVPQRTMLHIDRSVMTSLIAYLRNMTVIVSIRLIGRCWGTTRWIGIFMWTHTNIVFAWLISNISIAKILIVRIGSLWR